MMQKHIKKSTGSYETWVEREAATGEHTCLSFQAHCCCSITPFKSKWNGQLNVRVEQGVRESLSIIGCVSQLSCQTDQTSTFPNPFPVSLLFFSFHKSHKVKVSSMFFLSLFPTTSSSSWFCLLFWCCYVFQILLRKIFSLYSFKSLYYLDLLYAVLPLCSHPLPCWSTLLCS